MIADFTSIRIRQDGKDRVEVSGIKGKPNTPFLKISGSYLAGPRGPSSTFWETGGSPASPVGRGESVPGSTSQRGWGRWWRHS